MNCWNCKHSMWPKDWTKSDCEHETYNPPGRCTFPVMLPYAHLGPRGGIPYGLNPSDGKKCECYVGGKKKQRKYINHTGPLEVTDE